MTKKFLVPALLIGAILLGFLLYNKRPTSPAGSQEQSGEFEKLMQTGKTYYDKGEPSRAVEIFKQAVEKQPTHFDARLNLANAALLNNQADLAIEHAKKAIEFNHNSAAAHFVHGCANLRLSKFEDALKSLQTSRDLDRSVAAASFQLGKAHLELNHLEEAVSAFREAVALEPEHPAAHYLLSQALVRSEKPAEAQEALQTHQQVLAKLGNPQTTPATFERSKHTLARVPFRPEFPDATGIPIVFADNSTALGEFATSGRGPLAILDLDQNGIHSLFLRQDAAFKILVPTNGQFFPRPDLLRAIPDNNYTDALVADLQNDRAEDILLVGDKGISIFRITTNGTVSDVSAFSGLRTTGANEAVLVDLDFTGKLDLILRNATNNSVQLFRNLGNFLFRNQTPTSGIPAQITADGSLWADDWNGDDMPDLFIGRSNQPPFLLVKQRGGPLAETNQPAWAAGSIFVVGDINNDLRNDMVIASGSDLHLHLSGGHQPVSLSGLTTQNLKSIQLKDYDNDGWLDIFAFGAGIQAWRNLGQGKFEERTAALSLGRITNTITSARWADLDQDGDSDLVASHESGVIYLRNDGGNKNNQLKVQLVGNRSNASGLGVRIEAAAGGLRLSRTVHRLPIEIGIGKHAKADSVTVRWFDLVDDQVDVPVEKQPIALMELILPTGSCPYLYAWDGEKFRFITDLLGAAPIGLRISDTRFIDADTDEYVWIGNDNNFKPKEGKFVLQITEELREVLYLDEARLAVVEHPPGVSIYSTSKLRPGKPFPPASLVGARNLVHPIKATRSDGQDMSQQVKAADHKYVSPVKLREPQLRGLAETFFVELDFGQQDGTKPRYLILNGWLRFGGGMANVSASHRPELPFPFPILEVEVDGGWRAVNPDFGAPAGKTKTIVVDLAGKLPATYSKLKVSTAFEIHWDEMALADPSNDFTVKEYYAEKTDLHWRGFSKFEDLPWTHPLTPNYNIVVQSPPWSITPSGWCTRYGPVNELISKKDNQLALLNGGDELTLEFPLPPASSNGTRTYFLFTSGWDKDADFHVEKGYTVGPMPFHGMDDQLYGTTPEPSDNAWEKRYNTRWVAPLTLKREP